MRGLCACADPATGNACSFRRPGVWERAPTHTLRTVSIFQCTRERTQVVFVCTQCDSLMIQLEMRLRHELVKNVLPGVMNCGKMTQYVFMNKKSRHRCCSCVAVQAHRPVSVMLNLSPTSSRLTQATILIFIFPVNVYLQGVMKYTLHVTEGLCAVAADIIKLPWWMAAIYATKYCVCTLWNLSAWNTAAPAVTSSAWQCVFASR